MRANGMAPLIPAGPLPFVLPFSLRLFLWPFLLSSHLGRLGCQLPVFGGSGAVQPTSTTMFKSESFPNTARKQILYGPLVTKEPTVTHPTNKEKASLTHPSPATVAPTLQERRRVHETHRRALRQPHVAQGWLPARAGAFATIPSVAPRPPRPPQPTHRASLTRPLARHCCPHAACTCDGACCPFA